jgi:translocation and assembly module TamB
MSDSEGSPQAPQEAPAPRSWWRRVWGWLWRSLLVLVLLLAVVVGLAVGTEGGLRLALRVATGVAPGQLAVESVEGRVLGPLEVRGLTYRDPALTLELGRLAFDWRPSELFSARLRVLYLDVEGVRVVPGAAAEPPPEAAGPPALPEVRLPIEVVVERVEVRDARLERPGVPPLERLLLRASAAGQRLELGELALRTPDLSVDAGGEVGLRPDLPVDLRLRWRWSPPGREALSGDGRVQGPIPALRVEHAVSGAAQARLEATVEGLPGAPRWDARVELERVEPARLAAGAPPMSVSGTLASRGTPEDLEATARIRVEERELGPLFADLRATLAGGERLVVERLDVGRPDAVPLLAATGEARLGAKPEFRVRTRWQALQWPLSGEPEVASPEGNLTAEGSVEAFRFEAETRVLAREAPETTVRLDGTGDARGARVERLLLGLLNGQINASGDVGWDPEPRWDLKVALEGIDPGARWPEWAGRIGGALASQGRVTGGGPQASVVVDAIEGELRGYPVQLRAGVELEGTKVQVRELALGSGEARVEARGSVGEALDLAWSLAAPRLEQLLPGASGSVSGEGRLSGKVARPQVVARLKGDRVAFQENGLERLAVDLDLALAADAPLKVDLEAAGLRAGGKAAGDLTVKGSGSGRDHRVALGLTGGDLGVATSLTLAGGLKGQTEWAGRLEGATLAAGPWGEWRLQAPANLILGPETQAKPLCLASGEARICTSGGRSANGAWKGEASLAAVPLTLVQPFLPPDVQLSGAVDARASASGTAAGGLKADARVSLPGAAVTIAVGAGRRALDLSRSTLSARVDGAGALAEAKLFLGEVASVDARLQAPKWSPAVTDLSRQAVSGRLQARVPDLGWVRGFAPDLGAVEGRFALDASVAGTVGAPRLNVQGGLEGGRVEVPAAGLEVRDLRLGLRSQGTDRLVYDGGARSGEGSIKVSGFTRVDPQGGWPTEIRVTGRDFSVVSVPEYRASVSPDLTLRQDPGGLVVEGQVRVPSARIKPRSLPEGAVAPSADLVVKGEKPTTRGVPLPLTVRVDLRFGDQVLVDAFGLRGRLSGQVAVAQQPGRDPRGTGRVGVVEGVYTGLGRDLTIERGWLVYASSPLDNPGLDIQAVSKGGEVTAGVRVTGLAREPRLEFFSTPPRPQADVIGYLLLGRPLDASASEDDRKAVKGAAAMAGGRLLAGELGRQLGIDRVGVEEGGEAGPSLAVGQYLSPKLFVEYLSGLRSSVNRLRMRYDLTRRVQLQTETGDAQGADIFYTIER